MAKNRKSEQLRRMEGKLLTRNDAQDMKQIEGYFAVFHEETELWPGAFEEIDKEAFNETLNNDIRALINHDTSMVVGRNKAGTLDLKIDERGLWGCVKINENDRDAMNLYERVKRGDVDQCSFGFNIESETVDWREDGTVKWTINKVDLHEVSICTFPAYEKTGVQARSEEVQMRKEKQLFVRKNKIKEKLNGIKTVTHSKEN